MIEKGVLPKDTQLTPINPLPEDVAKTAPGDAVRPWNTLSADEKKLFARMAEVYAGFSEYTDAQVGRIIEFLERTNQLENTLIFYCADNGASGEGSPNGSVNENKFFNGYPDDMKENLKYLETLGSPDTYNHYPTGWAFAFSTPFQMFKRYSQFSGGTCDPLVIHWPKGIKAKGEVRSQFHHVIDVAPTVLEAARIPEPKTVNGVEQRPMDGVSMVYSFDDAKAKDRHTTQYFEMFGNRAIYKDGWVACTRHSIPWISAPLPPLTDDVWELYNVDKDFSEADNLAAQQPEKLKELQAAFIQEAIKNNVLPIDDRRVERFNPAIAGRPDLMNGRTSLTVYDGMTGMTENAFINVKGVHHTITAEIEVKDAKASGVIIAQAGYFGGWTLYMKQGKVHHEYNFFALERTNIAAPSALGPGKHTIVYEFIPDEAKPGTGGKSIVTIDGKKAVEGHIPKTQPFMFSADEGADVGEDAETNVSPDYKQGDNRFTGRIVKVTINTEASKLSDADEKKLEEAGEVAAVTEE